MTTRTHVNKLKAALAGMQSDLPTEAPSIVTSADDASTLPPSRRGKRVVSAYVDPAVSQQLRLLAVTRRTSVQALIEEALNDLFRKHGQSAIA